MKVRKIQEKNNLQLYKKKQKLKEKGITLIALVVTIIILLILAGVTLNMAMSGDGLFSRARNAADKYKKTQEDEQDLISEIGKEMNNEYIGAYVTGYEPTEGTFQITADQSGTSNAQTFTTANEKVDGNELKWRIWDYDGTTLRIILDRTTKQKLKLEGTAGYNNGVFIINEICRKCFGQYDGDKMKDGISVSNLKRSDIQKVCTYDYTKYTYNIEKPDKTNLAIAFGESMKFEDKDEISVPKIWYNIDSKWKFEYGKNVSEKECSIWETEGRNEDRGHERVDVNSDDLNLKSSFYEFVFKRAEDVFEDKRKMFKDKRYCDMVFAFRGGDAVTDDRYWLGTRCCNFWTGVVDFGISFIYDYAGGCSLSKVGLCTTDKDSTMNVSIGVRPVVSINLEQCGWNLEKQDDDSYLISK